VEGSKRDEASFANGKPGNFNEGGTADTTIGGKEDEE
jgi:hypothetical protein